MVIWVTGGIIERFQVLPFYRFRKKGSRFSREKNELDNILEYRYEKKKKFAVEKAVDILVNHTTPFRAFLPSTVICFIQILNNRSIPLHRYIHQRSTWTLSPYFSLLEKVIFGGERHHNTTFFNPFSLYISPYFHAVVSWAIWLPLWERIEAANETRHREERESQTRTTTA